MDARSAPPVTASPLRLERARRDDLATVAALERVAFSDPWPADAFRELVDAPRAAFLVARGGDDAPLGYIIALFVLDEGEIANLAVSPEARRQGVGAALLDAALREARSRGVREVYLEVRESNAAARALYASRGFVVAGRRRGYYRHPHEDAILLRRTEVAGSTAPPGQQ